MGRHRPRTSRILRSLRGYVASHRRTVVVDLVVLTAWTFLLLVLAVFLRTPRELVYVGILAGVVSYSLVAKWRDQGSTE